MQDNRLAVLFWVTYALVVVSALAYAASAIMSVPWQDMISAALGVVM
jgi:hypothetical protein